MKRAILMLGLGLTLAGCAGGAQGPTLPPDDVVVQSVTLTPDQHKTIEAALRSRLKDPESARFGRVIAGRTPSGKIPVCGYVNARNSFGGYTGEKPFLGSIIEGRFAFAGMGGTDIETLSVHQVCTKAGLPLL